LTDLAEKVRCLSRPETYGSDVDRVESRETHMSWVFLTATHVYKLKKPVTRPHLDFSTLEKRRRNCEAEVHLNRRLAEDVYLGVLALRRDSAGRLMLEGDGETVDWLVHMKRLPEADMLDERIRRGRCSRADIESLANLLAGFYQAAAPEIEDGDAYLAHLRDEQPLNRAVLCSPELCVADMATPILDALDAAIPALRPTLQNRIADGKMVEGHGDLRPEHVCLNDEPRIIDCLEFDRRMRILDPFDEVNYLGLECEMLGAGWARPILLDTLEHRIGDRPQAGVMALYGTFRLLLRARLSAAHLLEAQVRTPEKWMPLTTQYLALAEREAVNLPFPTGPRSRRFPADT